jgi:hypothetical protein
MEKNSKFQHPGTSEAPNREHQEARIAGADRHNLIERWQGKG